MKKKFCDHCGIEITGHDEYTDAHVTVSYVEYLGDDGSDDVLEEYDLCKECLIKVRNCIKQLKELAKGRGKARKKRTQEETRLRNKRRGKAAKKRRLRQATHGKKVKKA